MLIKKKILGFLYPVEASLAFQYLFYYNNFPFVIYCFAFVFKRKI